MRLNSVLLLSICLLACDATGRIPIGASTDACDAPAVIGALPDNVREASGLVISRGHTNLLWIHNDGEANTLVAIDTAGHTRGRVRVDADIVDWEDLSMGRCGDADCLYIADIGNNLRAREEGTIFRVIEPDPGDSVTPPADAFHFRYPDDHHDAEAMFVLPGERIFVITKGRSGPVTMYRYPGELRKETVTLERVQALTPGIVQFPDMVTSAAATPDGKTIAVRTYAWLQLYHMSGDSLEPVLPAAVDLIGLGEPQGEAIDIRADGTIFLASERGLARSRTPLSRMKCTL